ncbi:DENN domain-containing protein 1B [Periophthalmus magnuspinnatus]|uniref:DENN domain-containing protein 1B n=1 Tax=Periophthalmus magnuspinnatus TaxID=409849 RepID=UPI002436CAD5|nr:DENN domain-containing protein 1B [Periophthalmus magnuspinnatus]
MDCRIKENPERTFDLVVQVACPASENEDPAVLWSFPQDVQDQDVLQTIPKFCFPFDLERGAQTQVGQNFTFVLTDIDSKQRFGFCRLTQGCRVCVCLLSYLPWFEIFYKLLNTLADYLTKHQENDLNDLLKSLYELPVPKPYTPVNLSVNQELFISTGNVPQLGPNQLPHSYFIAPDIHGLPTIPESRNLTEYFVAVDVNNMLQLYASMLHERRIIITSSKLSTVSTPARARQLRAPPAVSSERSLSSPYGRTIAFLPATARGDIVSYIVTAIQLPSSSSACPVSSLKAKLKKASTATGSGVSRAFLRAQAALFGTYRDALRYKPGEPITFCEESFVNHRSSTMRSFLSMAVNLQLFKQFIDGRLAKLNAGRGFTDVFEEEITEGGFCGSNSRHYQQWMHTVKRGGAFINTAVTKAKSHAKRGIRDIKGRLKAREEEDEVLAVCGGSPTSTKSLSPRRLHKIRRQRLNKSPMSMGPRELGYGLDDDDTASKISSEDSADVRSYTEDSEDSLSLDLDLDSASSGQMNLLEEILDSLTTSSVGEQGKLSAAKSLDFFRSMEELDYKGPTKPKTCSDSGPSDGTANEDEGGWNTGQDDSAVHGKHLPPSPRRQPAKSSLKSSKKPPGSNASADATQTPPPSAQPRSSPKISVSRAQDYSKSLPRPPPRHDHPPPARQPQDRYSFSPALLQRSTPPSPVPSPPTPGGRTRTTSDPQPDADAPDAAPLQPGSTGALRRKVLSKETARNYQERALHSQGSTEGSPVRNSAMQVPWDKNQGGKEGLLGLGACLGVTGEAGAQVQGLLEEIGCCLGSETRDGLNNCNSHQQVNNKTEK